MSEIFKLFSIKAWVTWRLWLDANKIRMATFFGKFGREIWVARNIILLRPQKDPDTWDDGALFRKQIIVTEHTKNQSHMEIPESDQTGPNPSTNQTRFSLTNQNWVFWTNQVAAFRYQPNPIGQ